VFKFLYYATATVCGIIGVLLVYFCGRETIRNHYVYPGDYSFDLSPLGLIFGVLLTAASYFLFKG
jgi:H+/Cl- antiporter ClcA